MVLKILTDNAPELLKMSEFVDVFDDDLKKLCADMIETMVAYRGIGLAAPQIGVNQRIVCMKYGKDTLVMINPKIMNEAGFYVSSEGCLSVPNRRVQKRRSKFVKVEYQDLNGHVKNIRLSGLDAACVQHEIDHLNGILIA